MVEETTPKLVGENKSWIGFIRRVLNEARRNYPLVGRFLSVGFAGSNLAEFIQTKMAKKDIHEIRDLTCEIEEVYDKLLEICESSKKLRILHPEDLDDIGKEYLRGVFVKRLFPILQPLVLRDELPLPNIYDSGTFLLTTLENGSGEISVITRLPEPALIRVKSIKDMPTYIVSTELIKCFSDKLFVGKKIISNSICRIIRKIDNIQIIDPDNSYVEELKEQLFNRRKAPIVAVQIEEKTKILNRVIPKSCRKIVSRYPYGFEFCKSMGKIIKGEEYAKLPVSNPFNKEETVFEQLSNGDVLAHYPYDSFSKTALRFLEEAAEDPDVLAIKQTLYRVSKNSRLTKALIRAARLGKQVTVLLELRAKMDELHNLELLEKLEKAGCNILYGQLTIKTHAKVCLVVREENGRLAQYINISTGNFNEKTAKSYEDIGYFMKDKSGISYDINSLFNYLGGFSDLPSNPRLLIAPKNFRSTIEESIRKSKKIIIKVNNLIDTTIALELINAAANGVEIVLIVRSACIIPYNIPNIRIIHVVGRFLEHSRIYIFENDEEEEIYIGSGDLMPRNLDKRVEVLLQVTDTNMKKKIKEICEIYISDSEMDIPLNSYVGKPLSEDRMYLECGGLCGSF